MLSVSNEYGQGFESSMSEQAFKLTKDNKQLDLKVSRQFTPAELTHQSDDQPEDFKQAVAHRSNEIAEHLQEVESANIRVIVLAAYGEDVVDVLLAAAKRGMTGIHLHNHMLVHVCAVGLFCLCDGWCGVCCRQRLGLVSTRVGEPRRPGHCFEQTIKV